MSDLILSLLRCVGPQTAAQLLEHPALADQAQGGPHMADMLHGYLRGLEARGLVRLEGGAWVA